MGHSARGPARLLGTALLPLVSILDSDLLVCTPEAGEGCYSSFSEGGEYCTEEDASLAGTAETYHPSLASRRVGHGAAREFSTPVWHGGVQCGQLHGRASAYPTMESVSLEDFWDGAARQGRVSNSSDSARSPGSGGSGRGSSDSGDHNNIIRTNSFGW